MGSNNLDGRPTPAADIHDFRDYRLRVRCTNCGRLVDLPIGGLIGVMRIPRGTRIRAVGERLRCVACGAKGEVQGVEGWRR